MKDESLFNNLICIREKVDFFKRLVDFGLIDSTNEYVLRAYNDCIRIFSLLEKNDLNFDYSDIIFVNRDFELQMFLLYRFLKEGGK